MPLFIPIKKRHN